jgi:hypothetical protein
MRYLFGFWDPLQPHGQPRSCFIDRSRSQVQGSTFRVKDKEGIDEDPKASLKRLVFPSNCQFVSKFWITPDEADAFVVNMDPKCSPGKRIEL